MDTAVETPNFCCNCSHLLGKRHDLGNADAWRCYHPNNVRVRKYNLVTGTPITIYMMEELKSIRANSALCGPTGAWFELYVPPAYSAPYVPPVQQTKVVAVTPALKARLGALKAEDL